MNVEKELGIQQILQLAAPVICALPMRTSADCVLFCVLYGPCLLFRVCRTRHGRRVGSHRQ
jgi:hypothetical protein